MIVAIILLLFVSLFFSGSETALTASNKMRLRTQYNQGNKKAGKLLDLVSKPSEFITTILIGNNIANILLPTLVTTLAIQEGLNVGVASAILTITIIIFAEVFPKSVAAAFPDRISMLVYPVIRFFTIIFKPFTIVLNWLTGIITRAMSRGQQVDNTYSKEELRTMVELADSEGTFKREESSRLIGVLDFNRLNVKDILKTPRVEIVGLSKEATYEEVRELVIDNPYTRYPVYDETIDHLVGIFHSKFLIQWSSEPEKKLTDFADMHPLIVYEFHNSEWVFKRMIKENKHMAIVLDEYGGTEGIISMEDMIETMLGTEIEDEMDPTDDPLIQALSEDEIICDGKITLHRLNSLFQTKIPEEEDVLAGYLLKELTDFPEEGQELERVGLLFKVLEIENRTISSVQITKLRADE